MDVLVFGDEHRILCPGRNCGNIERWISACSI